jgi:hypothetical protein
VLCLLQYETLKVNTMVEYLILAVIDHNKQNLLLTFYAKLVERNLMYCLYLRTAKSISVRVYSTNHKCFLSLRSSS